MKEWKMDNIGSDLASEMSIEDGLIVSGTYHGFSLLFYET
jgi:hypothetical protein